MEMVMYSNQASFLDPNCLLSPCSIDNCLSFLVDLGHKIVLKIETELSNDGYFQLVTSTA